MFVLTCDSAPDEQSDLILSMIKAFGLPSCVVAVQGLSEVSPKQKQDLRKNLMKYIDVNLPNEEKFYPVDTEQVWILLACV